MAAAEVEVHTAALMVSLVRAGEFDAAEELMEWYQDWFGESSKLTAILGADDD